MLQADDDDETLKERGKGMQVSWAGSAAAHKLANQDLCSPVIAVYNYALCNLHNQRCFITKSSFRA